jgi:hypothetical protein
MLQTPSCNPGQPFVKLDPNGQASVLNYNLPSETCFELKGYIDIKVNADCWSNLAKAVPDDNFWDGTRDFSAAQAAELLNDDILGASSRPAVINAQALQRLSLAVPVELKNVQQTTKSTYVAQVKHTLKTDEDELMIAGLPASVVIGQVLKGRRPIIRPNFYGKPVMTFLPRPKAPKPRLTLVLHYKVCTFAGNYGAGKTIKTFSLLPGEETTISITTFRHNEETRSRAESILDSFSESSAQQFQQTIESQSGRDTVAGSSDTNSSEIGGGINLTSLGVPVDVSGGVSNGSTTTNSISEHISSLNSALNTHSSQASSNRDVSVNTEVSSSSISEQTESTVRRLKNINLSRVLNFVFRQLLQEYVTITYLDDVSIVFSNGYPESRRVAKLANINDLLFEVLKDGAVGSSCADTINKTRKGIFRQLCNIFDHTGTRVSFMECITETLNDCCGGTEPPITNTYARKIPTLTQTAEGKTVPGIILDVKKRILRTDSLVVDALLGQGEALDCYNQHLQAIAVNKAQLDNDQQTQQMQILTNISDPLQQADKYKKVFGPCCDVPQSGCGCSDIQVAKP